MKFNNFTTFFLIAMLSIALIDSNTAQVADQTSILEDFNGTLNVFGVSGTAPTYNIQGFFNHTSSRYESSDVAIGDMVFGMFGDRCAMFEITAISASNGGIINATVVDIEGITDNFPAGVTGIVRNTLNNEYPLYVDGISSDLLACMQTHFTKLVDLDIASNVGTDDQTLTLSSNTLSIEDGNSVDLSPYLDDTDTDDQTLLLSSNTLSISEGNSVDLSGYLDNTDDQKIDVFSLVSNTLSLSIEADGEATKTVDLSGYLDNTDNQTLTLSSNTLSISGGNSVNLSGYVNTDDQALSLSGNTLTLEDGGTVDLSLYLDDTDTDDQTLSLTGNTLAISEGNSVNLSGYLDNTDDQALSLSGNTLTLEDGGTVNLSGYLDNTDDQKIDVFSLVGNTLSLSIEADGEATKTVNLSPYLDNTDSQTLSLASNVLSITGGNTVNLSAYLDNTDNQNLTLNSNILGIEDGNNVDLSVYIDDAVTVTDGNTVDLTLSGQDIEAEVIASPDAGNAVQLNANGIYVPKNNFVVYTSGNATVRATDTGVTFATTGGVGTLTIPDGIEVIDLAVNGTTSDLDGSNNYTIRINETNSNYNTNLTNYLPPDVQVINTTAQVGGGPSAAFPFIYDEGSSPQRQITAVANGDLDIRIINMNAYSNWTVRVNL